MTYPTSSPAPYSNRDPLIPTGPANDAGPEPVDRNAGYEPALSSPKDFIVLHQDDLERVIDARVAVLKDAGKLA